MLNPWEKIEKNRTIKKKAIVTWLFAWFFFDVFQAIFTCFFCLAISAERKR